MAEFWDVYLLPGIIMVGQILLIVLPILGCVAYLTLAERKVIASMQLRKGPNVVGPFGLLQPAADGLKLLIKETIIPSGANRVVFILAPMLTFVLSLIAWAVIPFDSGLRHHHGGLGEQFEIRLPRRAALGGADGVLRGGHRFRDYHGADVRRLP